MNRFQARINDPTKVWKLSPMDTESINRWEDYSKSKDNMMEHTDTDFSPWYTVESDVKKKARVNCISHILSKIPYKDIDQPQVNLPERTPEDSYQRPDRSNFNYVPEVL
jgi:polyphosphate kinase 2 (PPK2 family)